MKIEIVENIQEKMKLDNKYIKEVIRGKLKIDKNKSEKTIVITPEIFVKIFSPERMKLLLRVSKSNVSNIYQLAKEINRKYEAVYRDIKILEGFGLIKIKEKDNKKIPFIDEPITLPVLAAS